MTVFKQVSKQSSVIGQQTDSPARKLVPFREIIEIDYLYLFLHNKPI